MEALDRSTRFLKILESSMLGFSYQSCTFDASNSKAGCARRVIGQVCPTALACTLEASHPLACCNSLHVERRLLLFERTCASAALMWLSRTHPQVSFFISRPPPSDATILTSQLLTTLSPQQQANLLNSVDLNTEERYLQMGAQVPCRAVPHSPGHKTAVLGPCLALVRRRVASPLRHPISFLYS